MNIIAVIHFIFIVLYVTVPFLTNNPLYLAMHMVFGIGMIFHWMMNSDVCFLTWLEHKLFAVPIEKTFTDRVIGSVYRVSDINIKIIAYALFVFSILKIIYLWSKTNEPFHKWISHA